MREVIQNKPDSITVVIADTGGTPLTGVVPSDITLNIRKDGMPAATKTVTSSNFRELDATELPGIYEIDFTGLEFSREGEFIAVIKSGSSVNGSFDQININLTVEAGPLKEVSDVRGEFIGLLPPSGTDTVQVFLDYKGKPVTGAEGSPNNILTKSIQDTSVSDVGITLSDVTDAEGWYSFSLFDSWKPAAGEYGQILFDNYESEDVGHLGNTFESEDLYVYEVDGEYEGLFSVGNEGGTSGYASHDPGTGTWSGGFLGSKAFYSVDGDGTADNVILVGEDGVAYIWDGAAFNFDAYWGASSNDLRSITYHDTTHVWACGDAEEIIFYNGTTATSQRTGGTEGLKDIKAQSTTDVFAVGGSAANGPLMLFTDDGGTTWTDVTSRLPSTAANETLQAIAFDRAQPERGVVIGALGTGSATVPVYYTEDAGITWQRATFTASAASSVFVDIEINGQRIVAVGRDTTASGFGALAYQAESFGGTWTSLGLLQAPDDPGSVFMSPDDSANYIGAGGGHVTRFPHSIQLDPVALRYYVTDLSALGSISGINSTVNNISGDVDDIKGGISYTWNTSDHSLPAVSAAIEGIDVDLSPVTTSLDDIKGTGFDPNTDSLEQIRDNSGADLSPVTTTLDEINTKADVLTEMTTRVLGLNQENYRITGQQYNNDNKLESATVKIYGNKVDTVNDENPVGVYSLQATYDPSGLLVDYRVVKDA